MDDNKYLISAYQKKSFDTKNGKNQTDVLNEIKPDDIFKMIDNIS